MPIELYRDSNHVCLMLTEQSVEEGEAVQANQFLIVNNGASAILEPGGNLGFNELLLNVTKYTSIKNIQYLLASHADPDVIGSLDRWLTTTQATLVIPHLWARFAPHFTKSGKSDGRVFGVKDAGGKLKLGDGELWLLPAHFLHSEGNFHFYDPRSKILFTGDLGVSMMSGTQARTAITDFKAALPKMEAFHRRYMVSNKVLRLWVAMARQLDIEMIAPQHGAPITGKQAITDLFNWLEQLACGIDTLTQNNYQLPHDQQWLSPPNN